MISPDVVVALLFYCNSILYNYTYYEVVHEVHKEV